MSDTVSGLNPAILRWARERSGYTVEDLAKRLGKEPSIVRAWEEGEATPTYVQLEALAYTHYKRPLAIFFFPEPPAEAKPAQEFRTLPDFEIENLAPDSLFAIRQADAMQDALKELNEGRNPSTSLIFKTFRATTHQNVRQLALEIRAALGIALEDQFAWRSTREALEIWRRAVEDNGVFVFKRSFKQDDVSGFCLMDEEFPVIYLNNSTSLTRQIFTLFHELAHVLLSVSSITKSSDRYIEALKGEQKAIEIYCNRLAAEVLVPSEDFAQRPAGDPHEDEFIEALAKRYRVSREMILRRFLDMDEIDAAHYRKKTALWAREFREKRASGRGGNYYATQASYLGEKYLQLVFSKYYQGKCTLQQLADYLNVKVKSVPGLEEIALRKAMA